MLTKRRQELLLFFFFLALSSAMLVAGVMKEQIPETLFNATLV